MIKVIVNDIELDLRSDTVVALTRKAAQIGSLQNRFSSFTNKFTVPRTKKNRDALGIRQFEDYSGSQYQQQVGKIVSGGIEIATNVVVVIESVAQEITLSIRAGNGTLFDRLNKTKLSDLDFSDVNHYWNFTEIVAAVSNDWQSTFAYPLCNTGNQSVLNKTAQVKGLIPFVFCKALFARIAELFGYEWTGSTYDLDLFEKLFLAISKLDISQDFADTMLSTCSVDPVTDISTGSESTTPLSLTATFDTWGLIDVSNDGQYGFGNVDSYKVPLPGKYVAEFNYDITIEHVGSLGTTSIGIWFANPNLPPFSTQPTIVPFVPSAPDTPESFTGTLTIEFSLEDILDDSLINSNIVPFVFLTYLNLTPAGSTFTLNPGSTFKIRSIVAPETHFNRPVSLGDHLPDWTMGKFIKEVGNIFGAIYDVDEYTKQIEITRLDEISTNKAQALDWSDKLDLSIPEEVVYILEGAGQSTRWEWKESLRYFKDVAIENEQLPDTAIYVKSESDYSDQEFICQQSEPVMSFPVWDQDNVRIKMDGKARFGIYRLDNEEFYYAGLKQLPNSQTLHPAVYFDYENSTYSLDWARLYDEYFQSLFAPMTDRVQKVTAYFKLNDLDIQQFKFKYPVFVSKFNRYFFVDEISEYTGSEQSTKVVLIGI
jgi:hypothetical protein